MSATSWTISFIVQRSDCTDDKICKNGTCAADRAGQYRRLAVHITPSSFRHHGLSA